MMAKKPPPHCVPREAIHHSLSYRLRAIGNPNVRNKTVHNKIRDKHHQYRSARSRRSRAKDRGTRLGRQNPSRDIRRSGRGPRTFHDPGAQPEKQDNRFQNHIFRLHERNGCGYENCFPNRPAHGRHKNHCRAQPSFRRFQPIPQRYPHNRKSCAGWKTSWSGCSRSCDFGQSIVLLFYGLRLADPTGLRQPSNANRRADFRLTPPDPYAIELVSIMFYRI